MSDSNFLNVEEIVLLSSCIFNFKSFSSKTMQSFTTWKDFPLFTKSKLNPNLYSIVFGIDYYQRIIQNRNTKKNLVAATLFVDCLKGLLNCYFDESKNLVLSVIIHVLVKI
jgi:hypothetical protein